MKGAMKGAVKGAVKGAEKGMKMGAKMGAVAGAMKGAMKPASKSSKMAKGKSSKKGYWELLFGKILKPEGVCAYRENPYRIHSGFGLS